MEAQAQEHFGRAYALIERVSELERFEISTSYQTGVLGDWHAAIETNEQWARAYPRNHFPHMWLTSILGALGQYEKAVSHGLEALRLNPTSGNSHLHLTQAYFGLGRLDKVREQLAHIEENGIDIRGPDSDARFRAYLGMAVGDEARVLEWLSLVEGTSREGIALSDYAWYLARKGRLAEARTTSRRASKVGERFGNLEYTVLTMVRVAFAVGDFGYQEEARARFLQAVEMTGGYPNTWFALGLALHGERERAEAMFSEVLAARPHSTSVQDIYAPFFEGLLALADEDVETAIRSMERTRPYDGSVDGLPIARFRADAYLANGQAGQAVKDLGRLISFEYVEPAHHYHDLAYLWLARAHVANDDPDAARESYEEFFERMKDADEGIPEIERAREEYAALLETGA